MRDPFSLEAEQAVLGAMMKAPEMIDLLATDISAKDFYWQDNADVFKAIMELNSLNRNIDFLTVGEHIGSLGNGEGGPAFAYCAEIQNGTPSTANAEQYARIVRERSMDRALIAMAQDIHEIAHSTMQSEDKISQTQTKVLSLDVEAATNDTVNMFDALVRHMDVMDERFNGGDEIKGIATGHEEFDKHTGGLQDGSMYIIAGRPKMGKEQPLSSKVLMANGEFLTIGTVKVGDKIASVDGKESTIVGVYPQGIRNIYKITMTDGRSVEAGADHLWSINSCRFDGSRTVTTLELIDMLKKVRMQRRIKLAMHDGSFGCEKEIGMDAWLLGYLLGDGGLSQSSVNFSAVEEYIINRVSLVSGCTVKNVSPGNFRLTTKRGQPNHITNALRSLGVMGKLSFEKFVPDVVFSADKNTRQKFLAGLLESDGWVEKKGSFFFSSSSEMLRDGVSKLVNSLGGYSSKTVKRNIFYVKNGERINARDSYQCTIKLKSLIDFIASPRILERLSVDYKISSPGIESIEYVRDEEAACIKVSHDSELYVTDDYLVTHNTTLALGWCQHAATKGKKKVMMYHLEMTEKQVMDKILAAEATVALDKLKSGAAMDESSAQIMAAISKLKDAHLDASYRSGYTMQQIRADARRKKRKDGLDLVMIDHLGLLNADDPKSNQVMKITEISRQAKLMAKELNIPVILLSQLNRQLEQRPDKRPVPSDLRDSGALEQDADMIIFAYRDEVYHKDTDRKGIAEIIIGAARDVSSETFFANFQGKYSRFVKLDPATMQGWDEDDFDPPSKGDKPLRPTY